MVFPWLWCIIGSDGAPRIYRVGLHRLTGKRVAFHFRGSWAILRRWSVLSDGRECLGAPQARIWPGLLWTGILYVLKPTEMKNFWAGRTIA